MLYELRTYHCHPGRLPALHRRFQDHTLKLFDRHGIRVVGFWTLDDNTLIYVCVYQDHDALGSAWAAFRADPEWQAAKAASEADGPIVEKLISQLMLPTEYSPMS